MLGVCNSSAKTYVFGAEVACAIRSAAARGEVADLLRARKGSNAFRARVCSMSIARLGCYLSKCFERENWASVGRSIPVMVTVVPG